MTMPVHGLEKDPDGRLVAKFTLPYWWKTTEGKRTLPTSMMRSIILGIKVDKLG